MSGIRIAIAGVGKIAQDQHLPTIAASDRFTLAATITSREPQGGVPGFASVAEMMRAVPDVQALAICTPPRGRIALIAEAFAHGLDVLLEKPPAATLSEAEAIAALARDSGRVLYASWHSRHAAAVAPACAWLAGATISRIDVTWKEDVRVWHPGQDWIWEPGIGVFDPGINALSVVTRLLPGGLMLREAELRFPANKPAPIAADLLYEGGSGVPVALAFDFDQRGPQSWDIVVTTDRGVLTLTHGASRMMIDGVEATLEETLEYFGLYDHFANLVASRTSDVDLAPFRLVADAFLLGRRVEVAPFAW